MVPAVCWATSLWPVIQAGLTPKLIDVDFEIFFTLLEYDTNLFSFESCPFSKTSQKSELKTEVTAAEKDLPKLMSLFQENYVDLFQPKPKMENGTKSNVTL